MARKLGVDVMQVVFRFAMQVGMVPLTGTTNQNHMKEDLDVYRIMLSEDEVSMIESIAG
jgi:diketogulonate reductase-like aldo/keto reductase